MAKSIYRGVKITGIAAAVPKDKVDNLTDHSFCSQEDSKKIIDLTGVTEYRKASPGLCASDLCKSAAETLLRDRNISPQSIEAIVFATMTPDYRVPSTACVLQDKLRCPTTTLAYDINMGCSGYVVGLYNACALIAGGGLKRVLLLAGDTQTKLCYEQDKNVVFILGDAGTATLLEADEHADAIAIELMTDGGRFQNLYVPAGGCRNPSTEATRAIEKQSDGGMRSSEHLYMNGMEIFKFSSTDVVKSIGEFMNARQLGPDQVDFLFLHQANKFMNDKIARKLNFIPEKVPYSINTYGNTGSASIPLTIVHHYHQTGRRPERQRCLLSGFGVGLSWGIVDVVFDPVHCPPIIECE